MTNIQLSDKGKAFLKRRKLAAKVVDAIASFSSNLESESGLVVNIDAHTSVTVKSASSYSTETV